MVDLSSSQEKFGGASSGVGERKISVLLIEDSKVPSIALSQKLKNLGYDVRVADCGDKGIELFKAQPADAVLVDFLMPGINGAQTAKAIRALGGPQTRIVVYSGTDDVPTRQESLAAGADGFYGCYNKMDLDLVSMVKGTSGSPAAAPPEPRVV
jgi:CheY-like chemotaxis protein